MKDLPQLIALSGTNGSGKDTVGHMLAERHGYLFVSVSDLLREEARRRGQPVVREVLREISAEWRREFGLGVLVDRAVDKWKSFGNQYKGVVACPMRNTGEAQHAKDLGGLLIWVDADPEVRYGRITSGDRGRAGEDDKTFEQFLKEEQDEMQRPAEGDAATLNMGAVKDLADITIENNGSDVEAFKDFADEQLTLQ